MAQRQSQKPSAQQADQTSLTKLFNDDKGGEEMPLAARGADDLARARAPRARLGDLLLMGVATHKLSRLISKDRVTSPLRAPFTEVQKLEE